MWYRPIRWYTFKRFNNRTHRELLIVDGKAGFIGGAGIADYWLPTPGKGRPWHDTSVEITGDLVAGLQTSFIENWLESSGEILTGDEDFPQAAAVPVAGHAGRVTGLVVNSTPSAGRGTRTRMLFQLFLAKAAKRGVSVLVVTPNELNNHPIARLASRRRYGELIAAGVQIHEYQPTMIHAKVLIVDGLWTVLGSTNFDSRSFGLNDEVNVALRDEALASRMEEDFAKDLARSRRIAYEDWARRPIGERFLATLGIVLERQE